MIKSNGQEVVNIIFQRLSAIDLKSMCECEPYIFNTGEKWNAIAMKVDLARSEGGFLMTRERNNIFAHIELISRSNINWLGFVCERMPR